MDFNGDILYFKVKYPKMNDLDHGVILNIIISIINYN
jgi:hypothetical protein